MLKIQTISRYSATRNGAEAIAEAFADYYANKQNSKSLSLELMKIIKNYYEKVCHMNESSKDVTISSVKSRGVTPRFLLEGYALYAGGDYYTGTLKGRQIKIKNTGFDFIGVKPDAPDWAKKEYEEWISE